MHKFAMVMSIKLKDCKKLQFQFAKKIIYIHLLLQVGLLLIIVFYVFKIK